MKKKILSLVLCLALLFCLCACDAESENTATVDVATGQAMLESASTLSMSCNGHSINKRCNLIVDDQVAGMLQESGFFDSHWNISAGGEDWFYAKFVTDEWINDVEGVISATTYGFYDMSDNCLGYCQERVVNGDYWFVFLDTEGNETGSYMNDDGNVVYSADGTMLGTANYTIESYARGTYDVYIMPSGGNTLSAKERLMLFIRTEKYVDDLVEED